MAEELGQRRSGKTQRQDEFRKQRRVTMRGHRNAESNGRVMRKLHFLVGNLLCRLGWHEWHWKIESGETLRLDAPPPDHATCSRCGARFGRSRVQKNNIVLGDQAGGDIVKTGKYGTGCTNCPANMLSTCREDDCPTIEMRLKKGAE